MTKRVFLDPDGAGNTREPTADDVLVYARGDVLGCEMGHPCYTVTRGIYRKQRVEACDLAAEPFNPHLQQGQRTGECMCGRSWVRAQLVLSEDARRRWHSIQAMHVLGRGWVRP